MSTAESLTVAGLSLEILAVAWLLLDLLRRSRSGWLTPFIPMSRAELFTPDGLLVAGPPLAFLTGLGFQIAGVVRASSVVRTLGDATPSDTGAMLIEQTPGWLQIVLGVGALATAAVVGIAIVEPLWHGRKTARIAEASLTLARETSRDAFRATIVVREVRRGDGDGSFSWRSSTPVPVRHSI